MIVCIAKADSNLGKSLKTTYNIGNVGNNDRGDEVHMSSIEEGIEAIAKTLNNQYLGTHSQVWQLSRGGGNLEGNVYASSPYNWNNNVINCLSEITEQQIDKNWNFRL